MTIDTDGLMKLLEGATPGPWQVVMVRNDDGVTSYMVREHTHPSVVVEREQYWPDDYEPETDADGYWLPDEKLDALPHRIGNARLIVAAVNALPALLAERERLREALAILNAANEFDGEPDDKKLFVAMRVADLRRASAALTGGTQ